MEETMELDLEEEMEMGGAIVYILCFHSRNGKFWLIVLRSEIQQQVEDRS